MKKNVGTVQYYIVIDSKPNKEGLHKIYLRLLQDRKKKEHFIGIRWHPDKFDRINEKLLPRYADDPDVPSQI